MNPSVAKAEKFSKETGWDFSQAVDRMKFLCGLKSGKPDDIMLSPECKFWSPLQELSAHRSAGVPKRGPNYVATQPTSASALLVWRW